jgi:hypothetical protein
MLNQRLLLPLMVLLFSTSALRLFSQNSEVINGSFYTLKERATTSAGVYKKDGTLVRTLWSGITKDAGTYEAKWDGTDDFQQALPVDNYTIKVISSNVKYTWEGTIGNSSASQKWPHVHRALEPPNNIVIAATNAYYTVGYDEMTHSHFQFALNNPQFKLDPFTGIGNQTTDYACTDGANIYWTGWDNYQDAYSWIYATKVSDNSLVNFSSGVRYKVRYGKDFPSVIDFKTSHARPSGIAVSADYIFVSYKALGYISVLNKVTGAFVRNLSINTPSAITVDGNDIWICSENNKLQKYPINSDGSLSFPTLTISGLSSPVDVRVNEKMLAVIDGGTSQQIKTFNTTTGGLIWTLGQVGGILTSPVVTNDRFAFWLIDEVSGIKENKGGIAFASDGSFWVTDPSNRRMLHFASDRGFIEAILYQGKTYACYVDPNNHERMLANLMEFKVDYTNAIENSWKHKYNWEGNFKPEYNLQVAIKDITTFANGRTYGLVRRKTNNAYEFVELSSTTGLRYTGVTIENATALKLDGDGTIYNYAGYGLGETAFWEKKTFMGFDGANNPIYSPFSRFLQNSETGMIEPRLSGFAVRPYEVTSSNVLVCFRGNREQPYEEPGSYHLGGLDALTGKWLWKTSMSTHKEYQGEYPADGAFDIGNGSIYQGNVAMAMEKNIIWGYNGEGWKGSQVAKWNHYYDNGLFVGQFGFTGQQFNEDPIKAAAFAGNAFSPSLIKEGNDYYMYNNDESVHGGIHRWKITNLNTIVEQTVPITSSFVRSSEIYEGLDLMSGLPYKGVLQTNKEGWTRNPDVENDRWSAKTNLLTYGKGTPPDLYVVYNSTAPGANAINRDLGNNGFLSSWQITGKLQYNASDPNSPDGLGLNQYLDLLDNTGKIIIRFYQKINYDNGGSTTIYANNTPVFSKGIGEMRVLVKDFQPIDIYKSGSTITVIYAGHSATINNVFDPGANMSSPTTLRLYFTNNSGMLYGKSVGIRDFRFIPYNKSTTPEAPLLTADDNTNTLSASHPLDDAEILVSENEGPYVAYSGPINIGNVLKSAGYWKFKIKAATGRNESSVVSSPPFGEFYISQCTATGTIMHEVWNNVNGSNIANNDWTKKPDNTSPLSIFEAPKNIGENYATRIRGYLCPPQSGNYTFWIAGDDATELWLSLDGDPSHKSKIAFNLNATTSRDWILNSSQKSFQIYLKAGNKYYIEALHKEEFGNDHLAVGWQLPDGTTEAPIPGNRLSPFGNDLNAVPVAQCSATGTIMHEVWNNVNGSNIANNDWTKKPDNTSPLSIFEAPKNIGENFAARIRGYLCPPQSGNYTFWIAGDDATELWLSSDADPTHKSKIAFNLNATAPRDWILNSSQKSFQIYLKGGNKYYVEALHKEEFGNDHLAVAWQLPDGTTEAPIPGNRLSPFGNDLDAVPVAQCSATGTIMQEVWNNVKGSTVASNNWANKADNTKTLTTFEAPTSIGDNYAARIRGYICAPLSGNYTFWISGDDDTELWLSTDAEPANKRRIAYNSTWTFRRNWEQYNSQKSSQIYLRAGAKYYIEAMHKEEYGGDYLAVAWQLPDGTLEAPIPGTRLSPFNSVESAIEVSNLAQVNEREPTELSKGIQVYPNPIISNNIFIQSNNLPAGKYSLSFINSLGETIFRQVVTHPGGVLKHSISVLSGLSKGIYLLHMSGKDLNFSKQLLK